MHRTSRTARWTLALSLCAVGAWAAELGQALPPLAHQQEILELLPRVPLRGEASVDGPPDRIELLRREGYGLRVLQSFDSGRTFAEADIVRPGTSPPIYEFATVTTHGGNRYLVAASKDDLGRSAWRSWAADRRSGEWSGGQVVLLSDSRVTQVPTLVANDNGTLVMGLADSAVSRPTTISEGLDGSGLALDDAPALTVRFAPHRIAVDAEDWVFAVDSRDGKFRRGKAGGTFEQPVDLIQRFGRDASLLSSPAVAVGLDDSLLVALARRDLESNRGYALVLRSTDHGGSFVNVFEQEVSWHIPSAIRIVVPPGSPTALLVFSHEYGMYIWPSLDGGLTWGAPSGLSANRERTGSSRFARTPAGQWRAVSGCVLGFGSTWNSPDDGRTWESVGEGPCANYHSHDPFATFAPDLLVRSRPGAPGVQVTSSSYPWPSSSAAAWKTVGTNVLDGPDVFEPHLVAGYRSDRVHLIFRSPGGYWAASRTVDDPEWTGAQAIHPAHEGSPSEALGDELRSLALAADERGVVHGFAFSDDRLIHVATTPDGATWLPARTIAQLDPYAKTVRAAAGTSGTAYAVWSARRVPLEYEVHLARTTDGGDTFVTDYLDRGVTPAICAWDRFAVVGWFNYVTGIQTRFTRDGGKSFSDDLRVGSRGTVADLACAPGQQAALVSDVSGQLLNVDGWDGTHWTSLGAIPHANDVADIRLVHHTRGRFILTWMDVEGVWAVPLAAPGLAKVKVAPRGDAARGKASKLQVATDRSGTVWIAWLVYDDHDGEALAVARSGDGGRTWAVRRADTGAPRSFDIVSYDLTVVGRSAFVVWNANLGVEARDLLLNIDEPPPRRGPVGRDARGSALTGP